MLKIVTKDFSSVAIIGGKLGHLSNRISPGAETVSLLALSVEQLDTQSVNARIVNRRGVDIGFIYLSLKFSICFD